MLSHICGTGLNIPMPGLLHAPTTSNQGSGFHPFVTLLFFFQFSGIFSAASTSLINSNAATREKII